jgi:cathepsin F
MVPQSPEALATACLYTGSALDLKTLPKGNTPAAWDWVKQGKVTPVKDQGQCGSCWAFSTIGNLEAALLVKGLPQQILSEQLLVDCSHDCSMIQGQSVCNQGCDGGFQWNGMQNIKEWGGVVSEASYPYTAETGKCKVTFPNKNPAYNFTAPITGYTCVSSPKAAASEVTMAQYLYQNGPLSIALNAGYLQSYDGGIIDPWFSVECPASGLDHAVLIVGYGTESGTDYWIVKNSWGADWGEKGYFRIVRGKGACGLNTAVVSVNL